MSVGTKSSNPFWALVFWAFVLLGGIGATVELAQRPPTLDELQNGSATTRVLDAAARTRQRIWNRKAAEKRDMEEFAKALSK